MPVDASDQPTSPAPAPTTRERILAAAREQFYAHGIRATSADRIIEQVGITKVTFYRHFRTKSDLIVAYLDGQAAGERAWMEGARRPGDPAGSLRTLAIDIGSASCSPGFRGCPFINAAAEFADPNDPVRIAVDTHRTWMFDTFASIASETEIADAHSAARQLIILRDGAMVNGYLGDPSAVADALNAAFDAVLHRASRSPGA